MRRHVSPTRRYVRVDISYASASCVCLSHADACDIYTFTVTFSPLGKSADRAIYFTFRNFFFFFYYEQSYLSIYWTDFHDLFTKWKVFA